MFNHQRLSLARERSAVAQKELAAACAVSPQTISNWESGATTPGDDAVERISAETGFPKEFFYLGEIEPLAEGAVTFRARSRISARQKRSAIAAGLMASELARWIEDRFDLPAVNLPRLEGQPPELVAKVVRTEWLLGSKPLANTVRLLESRGILVFSLAQDVNELDAFSFWSDHRPIVLLNTMKTAERSRTDAAHELFHLTSHFETTGKKEEEEANAFAGALLMPKEEVYHFLPTVSSITQLIEAKRRWGVSLSALVYRLHELEILSDWHYRRLFIELSKRGYRTEEPNPLPERERSTVLAQVFRSLAEDDIRPRDVARKLGWHRRQLDELIFGLGATLVPIEGGREGPRQKTRGNLRAIPSSREPQSDQDP